MQQGKEHGRSWISGRAAGLLRRAWGEPEFTGRGLRRSARLGRTDGTAVRRPPARWARADCRLDDLRRVDGSAGFPLRIVGFHPRLITHRALDLCGVAGWAAATPRQNPAQYSCMADSTTHDTSRQSPSSSRTALDGDEWMRELVSSHASVLRRFAAAQVGPDMADDVVSETFAAAWHDRADFDPSIATERAWLIGIALNRCRMLGRAQRRWNRRAERLVPNWLELDFTEDSDARVDARRDGRSIVRALNALPEEQRTVLILVSRIGLNSSEIAEAMAIPAATVRSHLSRARKAVAATLKLKDMDDDLQ